MRLAAFAVILTAPFAGADVKEEPFGKLPDGREVKAYTLTNKNGMKAKIISYGAILAELHVPDKNGKTVDVVHGFDTLDGYLKGHPYFGANVGRCANRIADGKFSLDGRDYTLATNNGKHHLHGGKEGFDKKLWKATIIQGVIPTVAFAYVSPDGEEGYPGTLTLGVGYTLSPENHLAIACHATTDKATPCNIAHHSYFNLAGNTSGQDILKHKLKIDAANYTPTDANLITTGKIAPVAGTPFDFTKSTAIGDRIKQVPGEPTGYDLNYVLDKPGIERPSVTVKDETSGRILEVSTTEPGVQFYTGNFLDGKTIGKGGTAYKQYSAFCLEPQKFPDAINKAGVKEWPSPVLKPGDVYKQTTVYTFRAE